MSRKLITSKELDFYLYGRTDVLPVKLEEGSPEDETTKQQIIAKKIPNYEGMHLRIMHANTRTPFTLERRIPDSHAVMDLKASALPVNMFYILSNGPCQCGWRR